MAGSGDADYDVVIIGGGISGLYTAWRLGNTTKLKILVLEATDRLGGRFLTCEMPGGFNADLGAMRFSPDCHPLLDSLLKHLEVSSRTLVQVDDEKNVFNYFIRNKHLRTIDEVKNVFSISDSELEHASAAFRLDFGKPKGFGLEVNEDGDYSTSIVQSTGQLAQDVSIAQYLLETNNSELYNLARTLFPPRGWPLSIAESFLNQLCKHWDVVKMVDGGYEQIIRAISSSLSTCPTVHVKHEMKVKSITEKEGLFSVKLAKNEVSCKKVIFACSHTGLQSIRLEHQESRQEKLNHMMNKIELVPSFKIYLTYRRAWWEDGGVFEGNVTSDWPNQLCVIFGDSGQTKSYATLVAAYTYENVELYRNLDIEANKRFVCTAGDVRRELVPSKVLVDHVHKALKKIMSCPHVKDQPVCAARMFWGTDTQGATSYYPKCGVDSNQLHWDSLKPFEDADMYITGDLFPAWDEKGVNLGFTEMPLLTAERILTNHFGLEPFVDGICVRNLWPK
ncbi:achacin-like [Watersipora subatra]|uniref:achacin-like n=1 Tax=Watersipora subatra TaxID=2589382 RepID=UPI00355BB5F1